MIWAEKRPSHLWDILQNPHGNHKTYSRAETQNIKKSKMRKTSYKITNTRKKKQWKCEANKKPKIKWQY